MKLKDVGLLLLFLVYVVFELVWFAAAITVSTMILWGIGAALGLYQIPSQLEAHWWFPVSFFIMALEGCKFQIKDTLRKFKYAVACWRGRMSDEGNN